MNKISIAVHGGAGTILREHMTLEKEALYKKGLNEAVNEAWKVVKVGGSAMDAVLAAVVALENYPLFNAGKGAVFTHTGTHEMDAAVMDGKTLDAGAVCGVTGVINPVMLAHRVMTDSGHVMLSGDGAASFARLQNLPFAEAEYFYNEERYQQWQEVKDSTQYQLDHTITSGEGKKFGTVGAVVYDSYGNLAAATSTGGMTNKQFGRIGDTPIIGSGTYANNRTCAISCTGHGEYFLRSVVAYDISCLMEYKGLSLQQACEEVVMNKLVKIGGEGGLVAVDNRGNISMPFNSAGMYRAYKIDEQAIETAIYK